MHTNTDAFEVFLNEFYIKSASRSNRIKCSIIYDKYILETKKAISKQTFYERIENLGFPKVIVNGERCFSNILSKPTETFS
jgi:predicted DNA-binding transcriptional regulator AlpA